MPEPGGYDVSSGVTDGDHHHRRSEKRQFFKIFFLRSDVRRCAPLCVPPFFCPSLRVCWIEMRTPFFRSCAVVFCSVAFFCAFRPCIPPCSRYTAGSQTGRDDTPPISPRRRAGRQIQSGKRCRYVRRILQQQDIHTRLRHQIAEQILLFPDYIFHDKFHLFPRLPLREEIRSDGIHPEKKLDREIPLHMLADISMKRSVNAAYLPACSRYTPGCLLLLFCDGLCLQPAESGSLPLIIALEIISDIPPVP